MVGQPANTSLFVCLRSIGGAYGRGCVKITSFNEVPEVLDSQICSQKFPVDSAAVTCFCGFTFGKV